MSDVSELTEQAARLTRQIGLIRTESGIDELNKKVEAIELKIRELRHDNHRLSSENWNPGSSERSISRRHWIPASAGKTNQKYSFWLLLGPTIALDRTTRQRLHQMPSGCTSSKPRSNTPCVIISDDR